MVSNLFIKSTYMYAKLLPPSRPLPPASSSQYAPPGSDHLPHPASLYEASGVSGGSVPVFQPALPALPAHLLTPLAHPLVLGKNGKHPTFCLSLFPNVGTLIHNFGAVMYFSLKCSRGRSHPQTALTVCLSSR